MYKGEDKALELIMERRSATIMEIAQGTGLNEDSIRRIAESLKDQGFVSIEQKEESSCRITDELSKYGSDGFPEFHIYRKAQGGASISDLTDAERSTGLKWAKSKGLIIIESGRLVPAKGKADADDAERKMASSFKSLKEHGRCEDKLIEEELYERKLIERRVKRTMTLIYTGKAPEPVEKGFDVSVPGPDAPIGRAHPVTKMSARIRSIMAEMGFEEMEGSIVESSFWNFDALFQPQDHPARELADTFYLDGTCLLPSDRQMVERVRKAHEKGWKYKWSEQEARKLVLRTHTTALSARNLANAKGKGPRKYFAIGRVFRNEATDYKHLAEFHQVEGIIAWEKATFTDLLGILKEFYAKLGFEKIRFRPSFFPYTEPSLEVEVYFEPKKQWMELGGAGIFRPEVSIPLAGTYPVLAWGLSLERPLMMLLDLDDIRTFYRNDLQFLQKARLDI